MAECIIVGNGIVQNNTEGLITDNLIFSLNSINFSKYKTSTNGQIGYASTLGLPIGIAERTCEVVSKCGSNNKAAYLFAYGDDSANGSSFCFTHQEYVGYYDSHLFDDINEIAGNTRHIVITNYDKEVNVYINGHLKTTIALSYSCSPNDSVVSLNSFRSYGAIVSEDTVLYELRFYKKILTPAEVKNNFDIFSKKYTFE